MLPSETMIWQPEFTDKTLSRKPGAVQFAGIVIPFICLYLQYSKFMVILSVNSHYVKDDVVPPLHLIRFLYSLLFFCGGNNFKQENKFLLC